MTYEAFDIVVMPFPFIERAYSKKRPVVVLSDSEFNHASKSAITAMVTTAQKSKWKGDVIIEEYRAAGLNVPCLIRLKLFTLDDRLGAEVIGRLQPKDQKSLRENLIHHLPLAAS